ncbi:MAG: DUF6544 family protein [Pseudomonadota bacterium]
MQGMPVTLWTGVVALMILHGVIHALGVAKACGLPALAQVNMGHLLESSESKRIIGLFWGATCLTLLGAGAMLMVGVERWWVAAAVGLALSQFLIIGAWSSAKVGTIANVLLAIPVLVAAATGHFHGQTAASVDRLRATVPEIQGAVVTAVELQRFPPPVRRWLAASGIVGRGRAKRVRLRQEGLLRTSPEGSWMPAQARQEFTVDEPAFVWAVDVTMGHVLPVVGRDSYLGGHGRMLIKAAGLVTVVDGQGAKIDQGTMLRYLGEIVWFPSAALAPYIRWEAIDDARATATMTHAGSSVSAVFTFDEQGRMVRLTAKRYSGAGNDAVLENWEVPAHKWGRLDGILIPVEGSVVWKRAAGDFDYFRWRITELEIEPPAASQAPRL